MVIGVIPARFSSSRFPGKPLIDLKGKTMIQRVYEQASKADLLDRVIVATDDERILNEVLGFQGEALMTSEHHESGTDRCMEVIENIPEADIVINIQGDEPLIDPEEINKVVRIFHKNAKAEITTLVKALNPEETHNTNYVKVVKSLSGKALYFSRSKIPFERDRNQDVFYQHVGIYGYRANVLKKITQLVPSNLERTEKLEQLRWLENDFSIYTEMTDFQSCAIDEPQDVEKVLTRLGDN